MQRNLFMTGFSFLVLSACPTHKDSGETAAEDPGEHACEHVGMTGTTITAAADRAHAPEISISEEPWTVRLVSGAAGYVALPVEAARSALLFMGTANVLTALYQEDTAQTLSTPTPNEFCPDDIPEHYHLDLTTPGTWYLQLGPAVVDTVWLMLTDAEGHAHHD